MLNKTETKPYKADTESGGESCHSKLLIRKRNLCCFLVILNLRIFCSKKFFFINLSSSSYSFLILTVSKTNYLDLTAFKGFQTTFLK